MRDVDLALLDAVIDKDMDKVRTALNAGANINTQEESNARRPHTYKGDTPLIFAARNDDLECLKFLLGSQTQVNLANDLGETALIYTTAPMQTGVHNKLKTLIPKNIGTASSGDGIRAFQCFKSLLNAGADINLADLNGNTTLMYAALFQNTEIVEQSIQANADIELKNNLSFTALARSVIAENHTGLKVLIKAGADINTPDFNSMSPLMHAIFNSDIRYIKTLITAGSKLDIQDDAGRTALMIAVDLKKNEYINLLLRGKPNLNIQDKHNKMTALMHAINVEQNEAIKNLIEAGADLETTDEDGETALFWAVQKNNSFAVKEILKRQTNLLLKNNRGKTIFDIAKDRNYLNIIDTLNRHITQLKEQETLEMLRQQFACNKSFLDKKSSPPIKLRKRLKRPTNMPKK